MEAGEWHCDCPASKAARDGRVRVDVACAYCGSFWWMRKTLPQEREPGRDVLAEHATLRLRVATDSELRAECDRRGIIAGPLKPAAMTDEQLRAECERRGIVAQPATSSALERVMVERDNWMESARQATVNADYYRGLVVECGRAVGDAAHRDDTGKWKPEVLCAKVPEAVRQMVVQSEAQRKHLQWQKEGGPGIGDRNQKPDNSVPFLLEDLLAEDAK